MSAQAQEETLTVTLEHPQAPDPLRRGFTLAPGEVRRMRIDVPTPPRTKTGPVAVRVELLNGWVETWSGVIRHLERSDTAGDRGD